MCRAPIVHCYMLLQNKNSDLQQRPQQRLPLASVTSAVKCCDLNLRCILKWKPYSCCCSCLGDQRFSRLYPWPQHFHISLQYSIINRSVIILLIYSCRVLKLRGVFLLSTGQPVKMLYRSSVLVFFSHQH